jgi:signal transduction histidine kinase
MMTDATPSRALRDAAHELNNLCSTILGFATLAEETDQENSAIAAYLNEIKLSTEGVAAIASRLRELSQELGTPMA